MNILNTVVARFQLASYVLQNGKMPIQSRGEIPAITLDEVMEARQFFPLEKFFIFGHARSGTTLLARLVRAHPEVHCNWQAHFFTRKPLLKGFIDNVDVEAWLTRRSNRWNRGADLSPVVLRAVTDFILERDARRVGKTVVGDKSPNSLLNGDSVRNLHAVYPDGRLLFIVRDGRDTAISHRFQNFIDAEQHLSKEDLRIRDTFSRNPELYYTGDRSIFTKAWIQRSAERWVKNVLETDSLGRELFGDKYLAVRYEDLLTNPLKTMTQVWQHLGVDSALTELEDNIQTEMDSNPDADWQKKKMKNIANGLQKGKSGTWQELFTPDDIQLYEEIAGVALKSWGYKA